MMGMGGGGVTKTTSKTDTKTNTPSFTDVSCDVFCGHIHCGGLSGWGGGGG